MMKEESLSTHNRDSNKRKTRRDFLASGIAGIAGSKLLAEKIMRGTALDGMPPGILNRVSNPNTSPGEGTPAEKATEAGRVPEDPSYYRRAIDFCREWNMNAYLISLADDQGCALRFKSHPELITHKNSLTHEQARDLARYAQQRGVELIPEIESFGHTH